MTTILENAFNSILKDVLKDFNEVSDKAEQGIGYLGSVDGAGVVLEARAIKTGSSVSYDLPFSVFLRVNDPVALIHYTLLDLKDRLVQHVFGLASRGNTIH